MPRHARSILHVRLGSLVGAGTLAAAGLVLVVAPPASAAPTTYTVNTAGNASPGAPNGVCDVDVAAGLQCNLRDAINESNANPGHDTIAFAMASPYQITLTAVGVPAINDPVTIDGTTQPGFNPAAGVMVRIDGNNLNIKGFSVSGGGSGSVIKGLQLTRFTSAIYLTGNNVTVSGNYLGLLSTGTSTTLANENGVYIDGGNGNTVGGTTMSERNVVGFGTTSGIWIGGTDGSGAPTAGNADGNKVLGNLIGLRNDGDTMTGNYYGVYVQRAVDTVIGSAAGPNVIAGSTYGVHEIESDGTTVTANIIGTDHSGTVAKPNHEGIYAWYSTGLRIEDNLLSGNTSSGAYLYDVADAVVDGNRVGTDAAGTGAVANGNYGIAIVDYASAHSATVTDNVVSGSFYGLYIHGTELTATGNVVGTPTPGDTARSNAHGIYATNLHDSTIADNTVSGNGYGYGGYGIHLYDSRTVAISDNRVGTDTAGTVDAGNYSEGVRICAGSDVSVMQNLISGNESHGLRLDCATEENVIRGNVIGRAADGTTPMPNGGDGISLGDADRNTIGGLGPAGANVIADNASTGVAVSPSSKGNEIVGNEIVGNSYLGIDLNVDGISLNDAGDTDSGGNALQNYPVLSQAGSDGSETIVKGSLGSRPGRTYRLDFYAGSACDPWGNGEGERYLGHAEVVTDAAGHVAFTESLPDSVVGAGEQVTATATDLGRSDTSEFSACVEAIGLPTASINDVTKTEGNSGSSNAVFTVSLSAAPTVPATVRVTTSPDTAVSPDDFTAVDTVLTFGVGETSKTVAVPVKGDTKDEDDETYTVQLSEPDNLTVLDGTGDGLILDNDPSPSLTINDVSANEPTSSTASATVKISLSAASGRPITVNYATVAGSAGTSDFVSKTGSLTFSPGQTFRNLAVGLRSDSIDELDETFSVVLSAPTNATIVDGEGLVTIVDTDPPPTVSISDVTTAEGNNPNKTVKFTVTLSGKSSQTVSVDYATADGSATAPGDYLSGSGTVTLLPGSLSKTFTVTLKGDTVVEPDEAFTVNLGNAVNSVIGDGQGIGTILNDD